MKLRPVAKAIVQSPSSELRALVDKLIAPELRGPYAKNLLSKLKRLELDRVERLALLGEKALGLGKRFLPKGGDFLKISKAVEYRSESFKHLFTEGLGLAKANQARTGYFRLVDEMNTLLSEPESAMALIDSTVRNVIEADQKQLTANISFGIFDCYGDLARETSLLNRFTTLLIPSGEFKPSVTYAAHHIVERRTYDHFEKEWRWLGWMSSDDMMATAITYEAHTYSPRAGKLPGFPADPAGPNSFSKRLQDAIGSPDQFEKLYKSADDLLDAYIRFYRQPIRVREKELAGSRQINQIVDALKLCQKELRGKTRRP